MQSIDPIQEQNVWSRVMNSKTACQRLQQRDIPVFDEAGTLELYTAQLRAAVTYQCLAAMTHGCARKILMQLAEEKRCAGKKLATVYFVMSGRKPCIDPPKPPCITCVSETLRQAYREEQCSVELYRRYAQCAGEYECLLEQLAKDSCKHAQMLLCALQSCL